MVAMILVLGGAITAAQVETRPVQGSPLLLTSSKVLPIPAFGWQDNPQCDAIGNLYFHAVRRANDSLVLKVSADGSYSVYRLSAADAADTWFLAFRANYDGKLWLLAHGKTKSIFLFEFGRDSSTSPSRTRLDAPENLEAQNFAVLQNGHILLQGYFDQNAPERQRGRGYFAEFDSSGRVVRAAVGEGKSPELDKNVVALAVAAAAAQGEDGFIYLLVGDQVWVVSQTGETVRKFTLKGPEPGYWPANVYVAGGRLAVTFFKHSDKLPAAITARYLLFDKSSGELLRSYKPDDELGNNLVCFSNEGFTFYRVADGRAKLLTATPK